jgi:hypothetical protein
LERAGDGGECARTAGRTGITLVWRKAPGAWSRRYKPICETCSLKGDGTVDVQETRENNGTVVGILILIAVIVLITFMFLLWQANTL